VNRLSNASIAAPVVPGPNIDIPRQINGSGEIMGGA